MSTVQIQTPINKDLLPRGPKVMLPHGGLPEIVSLHLLKLIEITGGKEGPIGKQFLAQPKLESKFYKKISADPLSEDHHEVAPGVVYKYRGKLDRNKKIVYFGRVLWTITRYCATYCRFCTRGREVGVPTYVKSNSKAAIAQKPYLSDEELQEVFTFLREHPEINEVIISGGDPLTTPKSYLTKVIQGLAELQKEGYLDIVRLGTRLPVHNPISIQDWHYELLRDLKNPYLMVHINHPFELTDITLEKLYNFRKYSLASILSQTVLLKGVNDSDEILYELFTMMTREGIRPYYVFQNDPVYWAQHFTVPLKRAIKMWQKLRPRLSGVAATARFVIDVPFGYGKVPIPEGDAWEVNYSHFKDFKNKKFPLK